MIRCPPCPAAFTAVSEQRTPFTPQRLRNSSRDSPGVAVPRNQSLGDAVSVRASPTVRAKSRRMSRVMLATVAAIVVPYLYSELRTRR